MATFTFLLGTPIVHIAMGVAVLLVFELFLSRDHTTALATVEQTTESLGLVLRLHWMATFDNDLLHFVEQRFVDNWFVYSFVDFAGVCEEADIERVGEDELHAVFVEGQAAGTADVVVV